MNNNTERLEQALHYASLGYSVFPLHNMKGEDCTCRNETCKEDPSKRGKHPRVTKWKKFKEKKASEEEIRKWWEEWPAANIAIVTGELSGIIVLDVDVPKGVETLKKYNLTVPPTLACQTGTGGMHYYFNHPGFECKNFAGQKGGATLPDVDFRGDGGYVVAPGSSNFSGSYTWINDHEIAECPEWLQDLLKSEVPPQWLKKQLEDEQPADAYLSEGVTQSIPEGMRNTEMTSRVGLLVRTGMDYNEVLNQAQKINQDYCDPPLPEAEVETIVNSIWTREENKKKSMASRLPMTDLGNAERMMAKHGMDIRYNTLDNVWHIWNGTRWKIDQEEKILLKAKSTVRGIVGEASSVEDERDRKSILKWAHKSEFRCRITSMIHFAAPEAAITPDRFDTDPWLLNVNNGTVDLKTGELLEHNREHLITKLAPVDYHGSTYSKDSPWIKFLERILPDEEVRDFVQRAVGYSLTGNTGEEVMFFLHGAGRNGKSKFIEAIQSVMGDYTSNTRAEALLVKKYDSIPAELAELPKIRMTATIETEHGIALAESLIKSFTGNDTIQVHKKFKDPFLFKPQAKIWMVSNHKPQIQGRDEGIWSRLLIVPFNVHIPEKERDKSLSEKLRGDSSTILAWAVEGCLRWQQSGLKPPRSVTQAVSEYRNEINPLKDFVADVCILEPTSWIKSSELLERYHHWAEKSGEEAMTAKKVTLLLKEYGCTPSKRKGERGWLGISLTNLVSGTDGQVRTLKLAT